MARTNWDQVAAQYAAAQANTGISAKEWCDKRGINYQSARRYLKSRGQSPEQPDTFQAAAQSAQKKVRKTAQNRKSAQSAGSAQKRKTDKALCKSAHKTEPEQAGTANSNLERDSSGRFVEGHSQSVGNAGNQAPSVSWRPGDQPAKTHGGSARFFSDQSAFDGVDELGLRDELRLCRARVISVTKALNDLAVLLDSATAPDEKATIYGQIIRADEALQRNISRVESIEKTLSSLRIDDVTVPKVVADTARIKAATRKLEAEATKLERDQGGDTTPIGDMVAELQDMGTGGLMSQ